MARKRAQKRFAGEEFEEPRIKELDDLGDELDDLAGRRAVLSNELKELKHRITEAMHRHNVKNYKLDAGRKLVMTEENKVDVKVEKKKEKKPKKKKGEPASV